MDFSYVVLWVGACLAWDMSRKRRCVSGTEHYQAERWASFGGMAAIFGILGLAIFEVAVLGESLIGTFLRFCEPLFAVGLYFICRKYEVNVRFLTAIGVLLIGGIQWGEGISSELVSSYFLAPYHVLFSKTTKCALLLCIIDCLCGNSVHRVRGLPYALWMCGVTLVFGMIWAHESGAWGNFWQWDYIEVATATLFLALYGWNRSGAGRYWAIIVSVIWFMQWAFVYPFGGMADTRHQYGGFEEGWLSLGALACYGIWVGFVVWGAWRKPMEGQIVSLRGFLTSIGLCIALVCWIFIPGKVDPRFAGIAFAVFYIFLDYRRDWRSRVGTATVCCMTILFVFWGNGTIRSHWVGLDGVMGAPEAQYCLRLDGVGIERISPACDRYQISLERWNCDAPHSRALHGREDGDLGATQENSPDQMEVSFRRCEEDGEERSVEMGRMAHFVSKYHLYRIGVVRYDARYGVLAVVRDENAPLGVCSWLLTLCFLGLWRLIRADNRAAGDLEANERGEGKKGNDGVRIA